MYACSCGRKMKGKQQICETVRFQKSEHVDFVSHCYTKYQSYVNDCNPGKMSNSDSYSIHIVLRNKISFMRWQILETRLNTK